MNHIQRGVVTLLKSAITGEKCPLPEGFCLEEALPIFRQHHMITLAYAGAAGCGISPREPVMQQLFQSYLKAMLVSERQMKDVSRIFSAFDENGIDYLPLKGSKMKTLYPKPELRIMGDADILIRMEQYDRIRPIMVSLGFTEGGETDHELVWESPALHLELHKRVVPTYDQDYYAYFGDGWDRAVPEAGTRYAMSREDEFIFLFTHFCKHYRYGGIGCRHVADLWVWLRTYPDMDEGYIRAELEKLKLLAFYENIRALIACWFGSGEKSEKTDYITEFILSCGSWGTMENFLQSLALRDAASGGSVRSNRAAGILRALFPPLQTMAKRYSVLHKAAWLLPVFWPVRWVTALLFRRENIRAEQKFQQAVTEDKVTLRQQALQYVGLDFNFE